MKITKAILTGGGRATRLWPITTTVNKHLLPLANKPMIFHAIEKVVEAGITDIFINTNPGDTELAKAIGDGSRWGINITFFEQTGGPQGIAHVVNEAQKFIGDDPFMFYLSDNILLGTIKDMVSEFESGTYDCMLALSTVKDPERFGVPIFDDVGQLVDVWEKPKNPPNNFAVTGIYLYGPKIFFDCFKTLKKSDRGEYEISDIHSQFLKGGKHVGYREITGYWKDTGKSDDLLLANQLLMDDMHDAAFANHGTVVSGAVVSGRVGIGVGTTIGENVQIVGPVVISIARSMNSRVSSSSFARVIVTSKCFGPSAPEVRKGMLTSVCIAVESSIFAFSAASSSLCRASESFLTSIPSCFLNSSASQLMIF
jgi:glucose-1-phosphate thymidylyltransferase